MSTRTKKAPIDPNSIKEMEEQLSTIELYREWDEYLRMEKDEQERKKRRFAREIVESGAELVQEIEEKNLEREEKRIELIEEIYKTANETIISLKELKDLPLEEIIPIHKKIIELKKPWWRQIINIFR